MAVSENYLYACHSGIQKAVRRGDLNLTKTCFDAMWDAGGKHRNFIRWRLPVLVNEDVHFMIGELAEFVQKIYNIGDQQWLRNEYKKFLYKITLTNKAKDTEGLYFTAKKKYIKNMDNYPELIIMDNYLKQIQDNDPKTVVEHLYEGMLKEIKTDYEKNALNFLRKRLYKGGMLDDQYACLAGMILIGTRGLDREAIRAHWISRVKDSSKNSEKPRYVPLPWYVYDMHTRLGKQAIKLFLNSNAQAYEISEAKFKRMFFQIESAYIPEDLWTLVELKPGFSHTCFESPWWRTFIINDLPFNSKKTVDEVLDFWNSTIREELKDCIYRIVSK
ncbi:MAG: hypothetical protein ACFFBD_22570 [Candidatus Hodarchaeota archaeon]